MRLFASVFTDSALTQEIFKYSQPLAQYFYSKPVKPENMHITLNFFGDCDAGKCIDIVKKAAEGVRSFDISVTGIGYFSYGRFASILWAGIQDESGTLKELAGKTHNFKKDFIPHITLARFKNDIAENSALEKHLEETGVKNKQFGSFRVGKISLIESLLSNEGARYKIVKEFELLK